MEIRQNTYSVKCPEIKCKNPIHLSGTHYIGNYNDKGGAVIQCGKCGRIFPCSLKNPGYGAVTKGGKVLDYWTDNFPKSFSSEYGINHEEIKSLSVAIIVDYEVPDKISWAPSDDGLFSTVDFNYEHLAYNQLQQHLTKINQYFNVYEQWYLKGSEVAEKSFVIIDYQHGGQDHKAVFAKEVDSENDLSDDNLYLIDHTGVDLEDRIDGIYTRDQALGFLERLLNRWRYLADEVLIVVPFIGFHYKNAEEGLQELWQWLEANVDVEKTNLITRRGTFNLFKKAQDSTGIPYDELVEWGLLEPLIESMQNGDMTYFQRSHAKYYVGVFDNYVEVLSGSFNIHSGGSYENVLFKKYDKEFFAGRYLHMFADFKFRKAKSHELVHYMSIGDSDKNKTCDIRDILSMTRQDNHGL